MLCMETALQCEWRWFVAHSTRDANLVWIFITASTHLCFDDTQLWCFHRGIIWFACGYECRTFWNQVLGDIYWIANRMCSIQSCKRDSLSLERFLSESGVLQRRTNSIYFKLNTLQGSFALFFYFRRIRIVVYYANLCRFLIIIHINHKTFQSDRTFLFTFWKRFPEESSWRAGWKIVEQETKALLIVYCH